MLPSRVSVAPSGSGTPNVLAKALESALLTDGVGIEDLIAALPDQSYMRARPGRRFPVRIRIESSPHPSPSVFLYDLLDEEYLRRFKPGIQEIPETDLHAALSHYPTLINFPSWDRGTVAPRYPSGPPFAIEFEWSGLRWDTWKHLGDHVEIWDATPGASVDKSAIALPALGGTDRAQHPLITWYLILDAFSMIARYYPGEWRQLLDRDKNINATPLE